MTLLKNKTLTGNFVPSQALFMSSTDLTLFWTLVTSGGPSTVEFYLEFSDDPTNASNWFQEVDEQDTGVGVVKMSKAIRTFYENAGAALADGTHRLCTQFVRRAQFARIQSRVTAGAAVANIVAPFGSLPQAPA